MKKTDSSKMGKKSESYKPISNKIFSQREGSSVKGKVVWLDSKDEFGIDDFPENKGDVAFHLAIALEDEENLAWYQKLARERRSDFLKNCLRVTLEDSAKGVIKKTKAAYFTGVIKRKTAQQERLKEYKKKHQKHTTYYGYDFPVSLNVKKSSNSESLTEKELDRISKVIDAENLEPLTISQPENKTIGEMNSEEQLELLRDIFGHDLDWVEESAGRVRC